MAAILSVTTSRVRDGGMPAYLAAVGKLKKMLERNGGKVRVVSQAYGGNPMTVSIIVEVASWAAFGAFSEKAEKDGELQALVAELRAHPAKF